MFGKSGKYILEVLRLYAGQAESSLPADGSRQFAGESQESVAVDIRDYSIETGRLEPLDGFKTKLQLRPETIGTRIFLSAFNRLRIAIYAERGTRPEADSGHGQDAAAGADVKDPITCPDSILKPFQKQLSGGMKACAESPLGINDKLYHTGLGIHGIPALTDQQPAPDPDRPDRLCPKHVPVAVGHDLQREVCGIDHYASFLQQRPKRLKYGGIPGLRWPIEMRDAVCFESTEQPGVCQIARELPDVGGCPDPQIKVAALEAIQYESPCRPRTSPNRAARGFDAFQSGS